MGSNCCKKLSHFLKVPLAVEFAVQAYLVLTVSHILGGIKS